MNPNDSKQFADLLKEISERFVRAFEVNQPSSQYEPNIAVKMALNCVNGKQEELLVDIVELTTYYLKIGPKVSRVNDNMKEDGKQRINILKQKYKLKDFASTEQVVKGEALSLKKLIPAFPYQLLVLMKESNYVRPLGKDLLEEAKAEGFPEFLKTTSFLSVIPFPGRVCERKIWPAGNEGIKKFTLIVQGVIAYEFLESFVLHKWGNSTVKLTPVKALSNVISVAQNILNSEYINKKMREKHYVMFEEDLNKNFESLKNLIHYTESRYPGFKEILKCHFYYNFKTMKFECKAKVFCRHVER